LAADQFSFPVNANIGILLAFEQATLPADPNRRHEQ
jgi:hypothetical protein